LRWFAGVRVRLLPFADFASATELDMTLDEIALWAIRASRVFNAMTGGGQN
jgi:hypothetical protein